MKICIFGAGAIGSELGGRLTHSGADVVMVARGAHAEAMQASGLRMVTSERDHRVPVRVVEASHPLPPQDVVIVCVKAHAVADAATQIAALLHEESLVVFVLNGLPWWYFHAHGGRFDGTRLHSLDPDSVIWKTLPRAQVIGTATYQATTITKPGEIHFMDMPYNTLFIGEPDRSLSPRLLQLEALLRSGAIRTQALEDIRSQIWDKLWGNIAFNPVTALTHATMDAVVEHYHDTDLMEAIMNEARMVGEKIGIHFSVRPSQKLDAASALRGHKTSMLQDMEAGRPTEIEAIVGAVREIGKWLEVEMPHLNGLYSLVRLKERFYAPIARNVMRPS
ncbi:MAG: 2-dehydropantoate 2-reductase [Rickettsiales bacterium]|nr:2-dehydropantoate 2-reductase [Rickettsiales bacterium]